MTEAVRKNLINLCNACGVGHDFQIEAIFDESQDVIYNKARGIGLSMAMCFRIVLRMALPKYFINPQRETVLVSSDDDQAVHLMTDYVRDFWNKIKGKVKANAVNDAKDCLKLDNGNVCYSFACNPNAIRSYHGDVYLDEHAWYMPGKDKKIRAAVTGVVSNGGKRRLWSTPNGEQGEFFNTWDKSKSFKKVELNYKVCPRPMYQDFVARERIDAIDMGILSEWEQEYDCSFVVETGKAIEYRYIDQCYNDNQFPTTLYETKNNLYMGIDFAKKVDRTWIVILEKLSDILFKVYYIQQFAKTSYTEQFNYLNDLIPRLNTLIKVQYDLTGVGVKLAEDFTSGIASEPEAGVTFTNTKKEQMFTKVKFALVDNQLQLPNYPDLIKQIRGLNKIVTSSGLVQYSGKEDDGFWALALALDGAKTISSSKLDIRMEQSEDQEKIRDQFAIKGLGKRRISF